MDIFTQQEAPLGRGGLLGVHIFVVSPEGESKTICSKLKGREAGCDIQSPHISFLFNCLFPEQ